MIGGAAQADVGILVISARKGEFETGFERGGQTREHAMLAKTLGVHMLIVVINKMDEPTVKWSKERFDMIEEKLTPYLKQCGYKPGKDCWFLPISGYTGANLREAVDPAVCPWWSGKPLLAMLDELPGVKRDDKAPVRVPVVSKYKDMGTTVILGKLESGTLSLGEKLVLMPSNKTVDVIQIEIDDVEVDMAKPGENLNVFVKGIEEDDVQHGYVLGPIANPPSTCLGFDAQLVILELLDHKPILTAGYQCVLHIHSVVQECQVVKLLHSLDKKTGMKEKKKPMFAKNGSLVIARIHVDSTIAIETFKAYPQLGRFTLRDEGKTIAIGKVMKLHKSKAAANEPVDEPDI